MIGAKTIQSFEDNTENARRCAAIYASTRRGLLRMHPWSFAKKRAQLAPVSTHPAFGYSNAFPLPKDFCVYTIQASTNTKWKVATFLPTQI